MEVAMNKTLILYATRCSLAYSFRRFRITSCFNHQRKSVCFTATNQPTI